MQYKERIFEENEPIKVSVCGLVVYDEQGKGYTIDLNSKGELEITCNDGYVNIRPVAANMIVVKSE